MLRIAGRGDRYGPSRTVEHRTGVVAAGRPLEEPAAARTDDDKVTATLLRQLM
jgi:hypothetical protein